MRLRLVNLALRLVGPHGAWARGLLAYRILAALAEPSRLEPTAPRRL
jgi:hypothetical protein